MFLPILALAISGAESSHYFDGETVRAHSSNLNVARVRSDAGDFDGDGLRDLAICGDGEVHFYYGVRSVDCRQVAGVPATGIATANVDDNLDATLLVTIEGNELRGWTWFPGDSQNPPEMMPEAPYVGSWGANDLTAVAMAVGDNGEATIAVTSERPNGGRLHILSYSGGASFTQQGTYLMTDQATDVFLLDNDAAGDEGVDSVVAGMGRDLAMLDLETSTYSEVHLGARLFQRGAVANNGGSQELIFTTVGVDGGHLHILDEFGAWTETPMGARSIDGISTGDITDDGLTDVIVTTSDTREAVVMAHAGSGFPYSFPTTSAYDIPSGMPATGATGTLTWDVDGDGDDDVAVIGETDVRLNEGSAELANQLRVDIYGAGSGGGEQFSYGPEGSVQSIELQPFIPASISWDPASMVLAYRVFRQTTADPNGLMIFEYSDSLTGPTPPSVTIDVDMVANEAYFMQFYVVDTAARNRAFPVSKYTFVGENHDNLQDPNSIGSLLCGPDPGQCLPKDPDGTIRIPEMPPMPPTDPVW